MTDYGQTGLTGLGMFFYLIFHITQKILLSRNCSEVEETNYTFIMPSIFLIKA